jgi:hypothetical protein
MVVTTLDVRNLTELSITSIRTRPCRNTVPNQLLLVSYSTLPDLTEKKADFRSLSRIQGDEEGMERKEKGRGSGGSESSSFRTSEPCDFTYNYRPSRRSDRNDPRLA